MSLSTTLLLCAIVAGLSAGVSARYRRWGTAVADLLVGGMIAGLFSIVAVVVLVLAAGLDVFGVIHYVYLLLVVGFPVAAAWIVVPQLLDAERRTPIVAWLLVLSALSAAVFGLWATHVEPFRLRVDEQILGATGANEPVVIGVIADLQTRSIGSHERAALDEILAGEPDVVVLPGDLFQLQPDKMTEALPELIGWMRTLTDAVDHVIIVNGNIDDPEIVAELADETGAIYLEDEIRQVRVRGQRIQFVGLTAMPERAPAEINPELVDQLSTTLTEDDLIFVVSHYPDPVLTLPNSISIDLLIAGHTHGGQVSLPRVGPLLTFSDVPRTVAAGGLHVVNGHPIYVSTGVGIERGQAPQLRFGVPPSVALITVVPI